MLYYEEKHNDIIVSLNSIKRGIARQLKEHYPDYAIYVDPQEEGFKRRSFSIHIATASFEPVLSDITDINLILQVVFYPERNEYNGKNNLDYASLLMYDCLRMVKPVSNDGLISELPVHITDIVFTKEKENLVMTGNMLYKVQRIGCPVAPIEKIDHKIKYARRYI